VSGDTRQKAGEEYFAVRFSISHWLPRLQVAIPEERRAGERECSMLSTLEPFRQQPAKLLLLLIVVMVAAGSGGGSRNCHVATRRGSCGHPARQVPAAASEWASSRPGSGIGSGSLVHIIVRDQHERV